jgi:hypothetical protein
MASTMNTLRPEPKKSTLGQFRPEEPMRGPWIGYLAMSCVIGSFILNSLLGWVAGVLVAGCAVVLGKMGLDSTGRGLSLIAMLLGVVLIGVLLTVLLIGQENIGMSPT